MCLLGIRRSVILVFPRFAMASNNVLPQLLNIVDGGFSSARKKGKDWPTYECAQIVSLEAKKAVAGRIPSLSSCQFESSSSR